MSDYRLAYGTYEDALRMVGATSGPRTAATPVSGARIQMFAAMVHDGNRSYWDAGFARRRWGGAPAPPALLMGWLIPPPWQPAGQGSARPASLALRVPLPGSTFINAANYDVKVLMWQTIIHVVFLLSALAIAYTDKLLGGSHEKH